MAGNQGNGSSSHEEETKQEEEKNTKTRGEKIRFYMSAASIALMFSSFMVFVFLIPFIIDPAVASLRAEFSPGPVSCRVVVAEYRLGVSRCLWSSCREGCTQVL